jgi:hypothetical protein
LGIPAIAAASNPQLVLATTPHGGHLGWFEGVDAFATKRRWVVRPVLEFIAGVVAHDPEPRRHKELVATTEPDDGFLRDAQRGKVVGFKVVEEGGKFVGGKAGTDSSLTAGL